MIHCHRLSLHVDNIPIKSTHQHRFHVDSDFQKNKNSLFVFCSLASTTTTSHPVPSILSRHSTRMKSQQMLCNYPEILCIQLKRFSYDRLSRTALKLKTPILIQPNRILDLSSLHYTTWLGLRTHSPFVLHYRLLAVCLHLAENSLDGHCVCLYRTEQSQWYLSDDEHITQVNQIEHLFQTSYVTENCYLLFYEKC